MAIVDKKRIKGLGNLLKAIALKIWSTIKFVWKFPTWILNGWIVTWTGLLIYTLFASGIPSTITLLTSGVLNMTSILGFGIPVFAMIIMFSKDVWNFFENAFYRIFRKVKKEFEEAYKKIKELLEKIGKKIEELIKQIKKFFDKVGDTAKKAANNVKKGIDKIKKVFGNELHDIYLAQQALNDDLDELDRLAPETSTYTSSIRTTSNDMVNVALQSLGRDSSYLGDSVSFVQGLYGDLLGQYQVLAQELS